MLKLYHKNIRAFHYDRARKVYTDLDNVRKDPILARQIITERAKVIAASLRRLHDLALVLEMPEEALRAEAAVSYMNDIIGVEENRT